MKNINIKKLCTVVIALMLIFSLAACNNNKEMPQSSDTMTQTESPAPSLTPSSTPEAEPTTITDREGKMITIPEKIDTIISMAPSITETLIHMGLGDKLVAVDKYSVGIEGLPENLPVYDIMAPDTESITALKPDIIFATGMSKANGDDPFKPLTDLGVFMTYIPSATSIDGIKEDIRFICQITHNSDKADSIIVEMEKEISEILSKIGNEKNGKTVYFEIAAAPSMYSFGKGTFLNEIIELLGAKNVLADMDSWVSVSEEVVIDKNPEIIFTNVDYIEEPVKEITDRTGWNVITAVKDKAVYQVSKNASSRPNEYVTVAIKEMATALYPDLFK